MHKITKAIIPVAGFGTRLFPLTKAIQKSFLPICSDGIMKPVILKLVEELDQAGIDEICLIVNKEEKNIYETFFSSISDIFHLKLKENNLIEEKKIVNLGKKINYVIQEQQLGFGHAVLQAKNFTKSQPVLMILGDTLYKSNTSISCTEQFLSSFDKYEKCAIALENVIDSDIKYVGISKGKFDKNSTNSMTLETIVEKPSIEYAHKNLLMNGKTYGNFGQFILTPSLFEELTNICSKKIEPPQEYQLMDAFDNLMKKEIVKGFIIDGKSYDMGNFEKYKETIKIEF